MGEVINLCERRDGREAALRSEASSLLTKYAEQFQLVDQLGLLSADHPLREQFDSLMRDAKAMGLA